jgi:hypothetical protein
MATMYELLLERLTEFNTEKNRYWENLAEIVSKLPNSYRLFLGLPLPGWKSPDGSTHSYVELGTLSGSEFTPIRAQLLEDQNDCMLHFALRVTLNPETPLQSSESVIFRISAKEDANEYLFHVEGIEQPVHILLGDAESGSFDPLWNALTENIYRHFDPELFTN